MKFRKHPAPVEAAADLNTGVALLDAAAAHGGRYALTYIDSLGVIERATLADVRHKAQQWSHLLRACGLEPGDRVVVLAGRDREWRATMLGVLQAGGVVVPCPESMSVDELSELAEHVGGKRIFFASPRARPDLDDASRGQVLSGGDLDPRAAVKAAQPPHRSRERDVALMFCTRRAGGLESTMYTHASLMAEAEAGESWLGAGPARGVWATVDDGSPASVWLMLAAWRAGAELISLEEGIAPREQVELLARLRPSAVWFADDEYAELAAEGESAAFAVGSTDRVLSDGTGDGAVAFAAAFGARVAPVPGLDERGFMPVESPNPEPVAAEVPATGVAEPQPEPEGEAAPAGADRWLAAEEALREKEQREAEEQRLADEALAREQAERRRAEEEQAHAAEEQQANARREAEEQQEAIAGPVQEDARPSATDETQRAEQPPLEAASMKDGQLAPGILSQITAYGGAQAEEQGERRDTA